MKYKDLLKENKTLQKKIYDLNLENEKYLELINSFNRQIIDLKVEIIRLTKQKDKLISELEKTKNPVAELIKMTKGFDIF